MVFSCDLLSKHWQGAYHAIGLLSVLADVFLGGRICHVDGNDSMIRWRLPCKLQIISHDCLLHARL